MTNNVHNQHTFLWRKNNNYYVDSQNQQTDLSND